MKKTVKRILESMSFSERTYLILRLLVLLVSYRLSKLSPRARAHWMGRTNRPRRPERAFMVFTFLGAILFLPAEQLLLWSVGWGSIVSLFVIVRSVAMIAQR